MTERSSELAEVAGSFIHEIKNHVGTLGLHLQILAEEFQEATTRRDKRALQRIQKLDKECQRLVDVSNDFLRFARVVEPERGPCDLEALLGELIDFFLPTAKQQDIDIKVYLPPSLPAVRLDDDLFKQAILNLLLNAQQAMPNGGVITFQATPERGGDGHACLSLSIIDSGEGMPADVLEKIFKPFYSRRKGGTGLGLPTTRRIVEAHQGTIEVQSDLGCGTCFTIRLPLDETT